MSEPESSDRREWVLAALDRYEARLARYAARLLRDEEAARDVVQHAFLRLCDQSPAELEGRLAPWLFTVCRNRAVDILRARKRTASLEQVHDLPHRNHQPDPAVTVERQDLYRRLNDLVAELPSGQREAVDLWTEGFAHAEIAQITGHSEGNVRVLVHRALKTLRRHPVARQLVEQPIETRKA